MQLFNRNIWEVYQETDKFLFTSNGIIKGDNSLVMGAGIAKEVRDRFKGIDKAIGTYINSLGIETEKGYGLLLSPNGGKVGAFQTKIHYKDESPLWLIRKSTDMLGEYAENNPHIIISMPYPGIGHGNRSMEEIEPIISVLPDNVHVYQKLL